MSEVDKYLARQRGEGFVDGDSTPDFRLKGANAVERGTPGWEDSYQTAEQFDNADNVTDGFFEEKGYYGRTLGDRQDASGRLLSHELLRRGQANPTSSATFAQDAIHKNFLLKGRGLGSGPQTAQEQEDYQRYLQREQDQLDIVMNTTRYDDLDDMRGFHGAAIDRGVDQVQQMGYGLLKLVGDSIGAESLSDFAEKGIDRNTVEMLINPRFTESFTDSEGFGDTMASLYESLIEQVPNIGTTLAASIASGGIGGLVGRQAAGRIAAGETAATTATQKVFQKALLDPTRSKDAVMRYGDLVNKQAVRQGMTRGAQAGAVATSVGMNTGETKLTFDREGIDNNALVGFVGAVKGALDFAGLASIPGVNRLVGMGVRQSGKDVTRAQLFKEVPFKVMKAGVVEGSTEAMQQVADIVAVNNQKNRKWSEEDTNSVIEALAVGAFVGKAFGTAGGVTQATFTQIEQSDLPPAKKEAAKEQAKVLLLESDGVVKSPQENTEGPAQATGRNFTNQSTAPTEQTTQEPASDLEAQEQEVAKGRKKGTFAKDDTVEPGFAAQGVIARVNDGKEAGVAKFRTAPEAQAYAALAAKEGVQEANRQLVLVDGAPKKSEVKNPEKAKSISAKVDGKTVDEAIVTPDTEQEVRSNLKKQYPEAEIVESTPQQVLEQRGEKVNKVRKEGKKAVGSDGVKYRKGDPNREGKVRREFNKLSKQRLRATRSLERAQKKGNEELAAQKQAEIQQLDFTLEELQSQFTREPEKPVPTDKPEFLEEGDVVGVPDVRLTPEGKKTLITAKVGKRKAPVKKISDVKSVAKAKSEKTATRKPTEKEVKQTNREQARGVKKDTRQTYKESKPRTPVLKDEEAARILEALDATADTTQDQIEIQRITNEIETQSDKINDKVLYKERMARIKEDNKNGSTREQRRLSKQASRIIRTSQVGRAIAKKFNKTRARSIAIQLQKEMDKLINNISEGGVATISKEELFKVIDTLPTSIAKAYKELFKNLKVAGVFVNNKKNAESRYTFGLEDGSTLELNFDSAVNEGWGGMIMLHEMMHGVTAYHTQLADLARKKKMHPAELVKGYMDGSIKARGFSKTLLDSVISNPEGAANSVRLATELTQQFEAYKAKIKSMSKTEIEEVFSPSQMQDFKYSQTDINEFVAVTMANSNVAAFANTIEYGKQRKSVLQRIFDAFARYFGIKEGSLLAALYTTVLDASTIDSQRQETVKPSKPVQMGGQAAQLPPRAQQPLNRISEGIKKVFGGERVDKLTDRTKRLFMGAATPFRSSLARLEQVSPALAARYKSRRGGSKNREGYLDKFAADESQWKADFVEEVIATNDQKAMEKVYEDFILGKRDTDGTKKMADFFGRFAKYLSTSSVSSIAAIGKKALDGKLPYFPQIHDRSVIRQDPTKFRDFLLKGNNGKAFKYTTEDGNQVPITESVAGSIIENMLKESDLQGTLRPEAGSTNRRIITDPAYQAAALKAGWLNKDPRAVIEMYLKTMTRQKAFEETFGGWVETPKSSLVKELVKLGYKEAPNKNSKSLEELTQKAIDAGQIIWPGAVNNLTGSFRVWAPAKRRTIALANVERRKGRKAKEEAELAMNAMDGIIGLNLNEDVRNTMQWMTVAQSYMLLAFSTITSLPEFGVMMAGLVGKSPSAAWKGLKKFASDVGDVASQINQGKSMAQIKNESMAMARVLGTIPDALTATGFVDSQLFEAKGNLPRLAMEKLFTYNGNILFNNALRSIATNVAVDYFMEKSNLALKGDKQAKKDLKRWSVDPKQFIEWVAGGKKAFNDDGSTNPISTSLLNFVDGHVARPTSDTKAVFGNDPRFMLVAQLKSFFYAYARDILPELVRTMGQRYANSRAADRGKTLAVMNSLLPVAVIGAIAIPLGMAADAIKRELKSLSDEEYEDRLARYRATLSTSDKALDAVRSSGILGPVDLLLSFHDAQERDGSGLARMLGPTASNIDTIWTYGLTSPEAAKRTIPLLGTLAPGVYQDWIEEARKERRKEKRERNNG